ncbi:glutathione S-transferase family protein [Amorphus sp. 3PC139-8]|uniref:glutathione S-transferase family protein n=1 Tax=Amorphus sp. 3PC139-8 TaxID=2735676 RepID=UPI00345D80B0
MTILLYDLCGADDVRFSPYCWRVKLALARKGLPFEARPTPFTEIGTIAGGGHKTVPVIEDGGQIVRDSFEIALYLEAAYPDRPTLFGGDGGKGMARFVENWVKTEINPGLLRLIVVDVHEALLPVDTDYFRQSREKRFGMPLEDIQAGREERLSDVRAALEPVRHTLAQQPYLSGSEALFADYILFGSLQWARATSPFQILADDDPVTGWFERCLDLFDGLGRAQPAKAA